MKTLSTIAGIVLMLAVIVTSYAANAAPAKILFWYPGEAGSTEEAQPVLNEFFDFLKSKDPKLAFTGAYFNTIEDGRAYLAKDKPTLGIVSFATWTTRASDFTGAKVLLATLPLPHGAAAERYALVGTEPLADNGRALYLSEPLERAFITSKLFPSLPASLKLETTSSLLKKLKDMSEGIAQGYALLTPIEANTLASISAAWAQKLKVRATSTPVPTARVVLFTPAYANVDALTAALIAMKNDPKGKEILESLRLTGFAQP